MGIEPVESDEETIRVTRVTWPKPMKVGDRVSMPNGETWYVTEMREQPEGEFVVKVSRVPIAEVTGL